MGLETFKVINDFIKDSAKSLISDTLEKSTHSNVEKYNPDEKAEISPRFDSYKNKDYFGNIERGKEMTFKEADSGNVNPNLKKHEGYQNNCQTCVVVFEARLRGWDIEAMPFEYGSNSDKLSLNTNRAWLTPEGKHPKYIYDTNANTVDSVYDFIDKTIKPGERYTLEGQWKGPFGGGHIISVFKEPSGKLVAYDPQIDKIYNEKSFKKNILNNMQKGSTPNTNIKLLRIDNLSIDKNFMEPLVKRRETYA
jgi:hypothetical protein